MIQCNGIWQPKTTDRSEPDRCRICGVLLTRINASRWTGDTGRAVCCRECSSLPEHRRELDENGRIIWEET